LASTDLLALFIASRRQGTSQQTIRFYKICLKPFLGKYPLTSQGINAFLSSLKCGNAKHAYYRAIRALCNWAVKEGQGQFDLGLDVSLEAKKEKRKQHGIYYTPKWVTDEGEIIRLGTLGASDEWFCGDGPGPSLRGILRGGV